MFSIHFRRIGIKTQKLAVGLGVGEAENNDHNLNAPWLHLLEVRRYLHLFQLSGSGKNLLLVVVASSCRDCNTIHLRASTLHAEQSRSRKKLLPCETRDVALWCAMTI
jgi:hypothetical protein